jgi:hypothetical protein
MGLGLGPTYFPAKPALANGRQHRVAALPNSMGGEPIAAIDDLNSQRFYHGTKADLKRGT